jgi:hypothetical protein
VPPTEACDSCDSTGACGPSGVTILMAASCGTNITLDLSVETVVLRLEPPGLPYPDSLSCGMGLLLPPATAPGHAYNLTFLSVDLELCCDVLIVSDASGPDPVELAVSGYSGTIVGGAVVPVSTHLWLSFSSDHWHSTSRLGFTAVIGAVGSIEAACTSDAQCLSRTCRGGFCCGINVPALCQTCNSKGVCVACPLGMVWTAGGCVSTPGGLCTFDQVWSPVCMDTCLAGSWS